jgi:hypothetical protein
MYNLPNMTNRLPINFNYYLFCVQQLAAKEQPFWSEEDLASFKRTVDQYIVQYNEQLQNWSTVCEDGDLSKPALTRTMTVESPFVENASTGEICDLNGEILATYHTQEERHQMYSVLIKKYEKTNATKIH